MRAIGGRERHGCDNQLHSCSGMALVGTSATLTIEVVLLVFKWVWLTTYFFCPTTHGTVLESGFILII